MATENQLDVTHMETDALVSARADHSAKGMEALDAYRKSGSEEDYAEAKKHLANSDGLNAEIVRRQEMDNMGNQFKGYAGNVAALPGSGLPFVQGGQSVAGRFLESKSYKDMDDMTSGFKSLGGPQGFSVDMDGHGWMERNRKALIYSGSAVGGPLITPFYDSTPEMVARPTPDVLSLVTRVPVDTDTIYWIDQATRATSATAVAEATNSTGTTGTKAEATIAFTRKTATVEIIAVTAAITEKELADANQIRAIIDGDLRDDMMLQLDAQILSGSGTSPALTGLLNAGIQTVGYSTAIGNTLDNMLRAQTVIMTANEPSPDAYVFNPLDWEEMRVLKASTSGEYLWGPPSAMGGDTLWGLPVIKTNRLAAGTGLTGAFRRACRLYDREQLRIVTGWINDDLVRNIVRVRAELRASFVVRRPNAIARVTGI